MLFLIVLTNFVFNRLNQGW